MLKKITDGKTLIALIGSFEDLGKGNHFLTENELPMQVGVLKSDKAKVANHIHKIRNRQTKSISNEFHLVVKGKVEISLYNYAKKLIQKVMLVPNMFCLLVNGGHGFEIVKDDTIMVEVKAGEFTSVTDDKEKF